MIITSAPGVKLTLESRSTARVGERDSPGPKEERRGTFKGTALREQEHLLSIHTVVNPTEQFH